MYTRVATICIEDSIVSKSSISYRFTTELGLTAATKAMEKFLKELHSPDLVHILKSKTSSEIFKSSELQNDVLAIKGLEVSIKNEDLDKIESNDEAQFFCVNHGLPDSLEELKWFLNIQLGLGS